MRKQIRLSENFFGQPYLLIDKLTNQLIVKLTTLWLNRL